MFKEIVLQHKAEKERILSQNWVEREKLPFDPDRLGRATRNKIEGCAHQVYSFI